MPLLNIIPHEQIVDGTKRLIFIIVIIIFTFIIQKIVKRFMNRSFKKSSKILKVDETQYNFFKHFVSALIYIIGFGVAIYAIPSLRTISISIFASAGILAVIIGFASQQAFSNIISGIFITIFKPFRVGDRVKIGKELRGIVEDINLRHTIIRNFENNRIVVPNSVISSEIIENSDLNDQKLCRFIEFGISYDSDINLAMKIMKEGAEKHPFTIDNRTQEEKNKKQPVVRVKVVALTDSAVILRAWVWSNDPQSSFEMNCDLLKSIKEKFDKEGIEIPFPHRTIVYKKDIKK